MTLPEQDTLNSLVARVFQISDVTLGKGGTEFLYRYRGTLTGEDSAAAYDQLAEALRPHGLMPLFRKDEDGSHLIFLVPAPPAPKPSNPRINIILFVLTVLSVMLAGAQIPANVAIPEDALGQLMLFYKYMFTGWPFALGLMSILLAHEFGHYFAGRYHKVALSLPYFIPLPLVGGIGTMGAVIRMKEMPKNRRILLDVGIAGPLAGLVVAIPVLLYGLSISTLGPVISTAGGFIEGNSATYLLAKIPRFWEIPPSPLGYWGMVPFFFLARLFFTRPPGPGRRPGVVLFPGAFPGLGRPLVN